MKKNLTLYLILTAFVSFAQNEKIDSLQQALKNYDAKKLELHKNLLPGESDTTKVNILTNLGLEFQMVSDYALAKKYTDEALALAQQIGFKRGIGKCYSVIGIIYRNQGNLQEALKNHFTALKIREEIGDKKGIAASYNNIGIIYYQQGNYPEALKNDYASLKLREEMGDKFGIAASYTEIGMVYWQQDKNSEALKNHLAALKIFQETGNKFAIAGAYNNLGISYENLGNDEEALKNYFAGLKIQEEIGDKDGIAATYSCIGINYRDNGKYPEALKYLFAGLKIKEEIGDSIGIAAGCFEIGMAKFNMGAAGEAKVWLMKGLQLAKNTDNKPLIANSHDWLGAVDSALGDFKSAFEHQKLYMYYNDSIHNEENTRKQTQTEMQYEFDKKQIADSVKFAQEKELAAVKLQKQKAITYSGFAGVAITIILLFFVYRNYNKQRIANQKLKEAQEQLIKSEKMAAFGMMASRVSHEIQNPLNFVNNFSDLAEEMVNDIVKLNSEHERSETAKGLINNLQKIKHHGMRADTIVKQLQEHTRAGTAHEYFDENKS